MNIKISERKLEIKITETSKFKYGGYPDVYTVPGTLEYEAIHWPW